jgi:hypothetical protein
VLTGCAAPGAVPVEATTTPAPASSEFTLPPTTAGDHGSDEEDQPTQVPLPVWDDVARRDALRTAEAALNAFARPDLAQEAWWEGFAPFLSPAAAAGYVATDPANIPVSVVTGPGRLLEEASPFLARVELDTDAGAHVVLLSRTEQSSAWVVEQISPVEER